MFNMDIMVNPWNYYEFQAPMFHPGYGQDWAGKKHVYFQTAGHFPTWYGALMDSSIMTLIWREHTRLTLAMGSHRRLGEGSILSQIDTEIFEFIGMHINPTMFPAGELY